MKDNKLKEIHSKLTEITNLINTKFVGQENAIITTCINYFEELKK